jgi:feruloyl esterase
MLIRALIIRRLMQLACLSATVAPFAAHATRCEDLHTLKLKQTVISESVRVPAGVFKDPNAGPWPAEDVPERCQVKGVIRPAPDSEINFEIWMPIASWNHKLQGAGNGGFGGSLNYQSGLVQALQRGYAGVTTDTGHTGKLEEASWAIGHPEKVVDFAYRAVHLMTVNAKAIVKAFYGTAPRRAYFASCSNGGRQALMLAQRFPEDYDGIIAGAPANDWTGLMLDFIWNQRAMMKPGAFIPADRAPAIQAEVNRQCDALDGVADGIIGAPQSCHFRPEALLCQSGESSSCLTQPQVESLQAIYQGMSAAHGTIRFPGFTPGAEATSWAGWIFGQKLGESAQARYGWGYVSAMVRQDPNWKVEQLDFDRDVPAIIEKYGPLMNATNPDLSRFAARGGKLILFHGWADAAVPPLNTIRYFDGVGAKMGEQRRGEFVRLFMAPGMQHCVGGPGPSVFGEHTAAQQPPNPDVDLAAALERWVDGGPAPEQVRATKPKDLLAGAFGSTKGGVESTSLLCAYPKRAKWDGVSNPSDAASYTCAAQP